MSEGSAFGNIADVGFGGVGEATLSGCTQFWRSSPAIGIGSVVGGAGVGDASPSPASTVPGSVGTDMRGADNSAKRSPNAVASESWTPSVESDKADSRRLDNPESFVAIAFSTDAGAPIRQVFRARI